MSAEVSPVPPKYESDLYSYDQYSFCYMSHWLVEGGDHSFAFVAIAQDANA